MITNLEINPMILGFDRSMRVFKRASKPIESAIKRRSRFTSNQERRHKKNKRARRSARLSAVNGLNPLSLCVMQMKEAEAAYQLRIPVEQNCSLAGDRGQTKVSASAVVGGHSQGVLTIIEFDSCPPEMVVLKDKDKDLLRFPFGMRDPEDSTIFVAARRECLEEAFYELGVELPEFTDKDSLGVIFVSANHSVDVFHIVLSSDIQVSPGEEQEEVFRAPIALVDKYVARGLFSQTHCVAWDLYKKKIPPLRAGAG